MVAPMTASLIAPMASSMIKPAASWLINGKGEKDSGVQEKGK